MNAIYNEIDPFACAWLERLIECGHVGPGIVERRSIADLTPADVVGPGQRHFFAGIGVWSHALRLAGIADDEDVWTGSCPCQPFSGAGKGLGVRDPRHLWPAWFELIRECRPATIFGEQVASRDGLAWLDLVRSDLEGCGYAVGASDLCAAGVGAPHIRQRLYFVAYANDGSERQRVHVQVHVQKREPRREVSHADRRCEDGIVADAAGARREREGRAWIGSQHRGGMDGARCDHAPIAPSATRDPWRDVEWIACRDGRARPVEPGTFPLAHGAPRRVGRLRGYGNAIVAEVAATFIAAAEAAREPTSNQHP